MKKTETEKQTMQPNKISKQRCLLSANLWSDREKNGQKNPVHKVLRNSGICKNKHTKTLIYLELD